MEPFLLATKLRIPPQSHLLVHRPRLIEALEREIPTYKLGLITAPAGYGKTTLLTQWATSSEYRMAWLSIDETDNDPDRFLRYLLAAWEGVQQDIVESPFGLLMGGMSPDHQAVLPAFINAASEVPAHTIFVLDDYHLIDDEAIHGAMTFLLDHLPSRVHFVLASRTEPPLPLARYRVRQELLQLQVKDLQFAQEETADFFNRTTTFDLSHEDIASLQEQLEGWVAGMRLVALSRQRQPENIEKLVVSGKHRFIADFLSEDVLAALDEETRDFLLQTSILDRWCGGLCDAVTGRDNGQTMLENLERQNLFLVALDDNREWFRYHHLFADFIREEFRRREPERIPELHCRAARWYLGNDLPEPAMRHAIPGEDVELVIEIAERYVAAKLLGGEVKIVQQWLDALPQAWRLEYPAFSLFEAAVLLVTGQFEAAAHSLDEIERQASAQDESAQWPLARVKALRCYIACYRNDLEGAETLADDALRDLPENDVGFRPGIYGALGDTYRRHAHWQEAKNAYLELLNYAHAPSFRVEAAHVYGALADLALRQGHLRNAVSYWEKALSAIQERENWGSYPLPLTGWVYIRMGELLYEQNQLAEAWEHVSRGLERAELGGDVRALIAGFLIAGRIKLSEGDAEAGADYLERTRPLVENTQFAHWLSRFERFQLELWLAQDWLRGAVQWSDMMLRDATITERPESEIAQLAMARVLIVKGDHPSIERALSFIEPLLHMAETDGRMGVEIEALTLQALAEARRGYRANALTSLVRALRLAEPEGYLRLFIDLGLPMARLLQEARSREVLPDYVDRLLAIFGDDLPLPAHAGLALPEPLTHREQEILELVAAGLTNQEIAEQLVISPETVKKHTGNIYGKLNVGNRTEAATRARELDLLN